MNNLGAPEPTLEESSFEDLKLRLLDALRRAMQAMKRDSGQAERFRELIEHLIESHFNLAVVGEFSRGKSSLMNAMLGMDRLPTGVVPVTSVITAVRHGSRERALLHFETRGLPQEIPLPKLGDYVTDRANPGNRRRIRLAEVYLPAELLRRGFFFVDTPGLGALAENTATTERFLPHADAAVFVTSFDHPLSESELQYLRGIWRQVGRVFLVLNKLDIVSETERGEVRAFIRQRLAAEFAAEPVLYEVSAREALQARLENDAERLAASGVPALERDLADFLAQHKARHLLLRTCDRALEVLREEGTAKTGIGFAELRQEIGAVLRAADADQFHHRTSVWLESGAGPASQVAPCPVCETVVREMFEYFSQAQYALARDPGAQRDHQRQGGFCPLHTWQYAQLASPYGVDSAYPPILSAIAKQLRTVAESKEDRQAMVASVQGALADEVRCPACARQRRFEANVIQALCAEVEQRRSEGKTPALCVPHLRVALAASACRDVRTELLKAEALALERSAENMRTYAAKHDARRRELAARDESQAHELGLGHLAGHKRLVAPWSFDRNI
jgi:GTP-binding protein EngB required for normal cell division